MDTMIKENTFRYKLISTKESSLKFDNCEVCGKHCSEVYHQIEERSYLNPVSKTISWTFDKCQSRFGHRQCLVSRMKLSSDSTITVNGYTIEHNDFWNRLQVSHPNIGPVVEEFTTGEWAEAIEYCHKG